MNFRTQKNSHAYKYKQTSKQQDTHSNFPYYVIRPTCKPWSVNRITRTDRLIKVQKDDGFFFLACDDFWENV